MTVPVRTAVLDRLQDAGVVAVIRAGTAEQARRTVAALVRGGLTGVEIAYTTPGAGEAIAAVRADHGPEVVVGAGTLVTTAQVDEAVAAGAEFLVSPGTRPEVAAHLVATGRASLRGALTPTEVMAALEHAPDAVKISRGFASAGPDHLRALRGPFPELRAVPTGGVSTGNLVDWFDAGALAVGAGSDLCPPAVLDAGDWDEITRRARGYRAALDAVWAARPR